MKSKLYSVSLLLLWATLYATVASACGGGWVWPKYEFMVYRVDGLPQTGLSASELRERNIQLWMRQTHRTHAEIEKAVYGEVDDEYEHRLESQYLKGDTAAVRLLRLARKCEEARQQMSSAWYYAVEGDEPQTVLMEVAKTAEAMGQTRSRMRERYVVQALRARFALRKYAECLTYWTGVDKTMTESVMRDFAMPYVAGCLYHLRKPEAAIAIFLHYGDMESVRLCTQMIEDRDFDDEKVENFEDSPRNDNRNWESYFRVEHLRLAAQYCPDVPDLVTIIENYINTRVHDEYFSDYDDEVARLKTMLPFVLDAAKRCAPTNRGLWCYLAAVLSDRVGKASDVLHYLSKAKACPITKRMQDYIRLLEEDVYFRVSPVNGDYYARIEKAVKWMDARMVNAFDRDAVSGNMRPYGYWPFSQTATDESDFWNMALRHVVLNNICTRLDAKRDYQTMFQLANYAQNRYLHLCDGAMVLEDDYYVYNSVISEYVLEEGTKYEPFDYAGTIRIKNPNKKGLNYVTPLFCLADSMPADTMREYIRWMERQHTGFEALLAKGSNTDRDYWYEMLGTHYLREMRYEEAVEALSMVSVDFHRATNLYKEKLFDRNPFAVEPRHNKGVNQPLYKLHFAELMAELKIAITCGEINQRAENMLLYSLGLKNCVGDCWALTSYYYTANDYGHVPYAWDGMCYYDNLQNESQRMEQLAFLTFTDREQKARALVRHNRRLEVMRDMPETDVAFFLKQHCDLWHDYAAHRNMH